MKTKLLLFFIFCGFLGFGQTTLYSENFGTTTTLPAGWISSNNTNGWSCNAGSTSNGYTGSSAGSNILFNGTGTNGVSHTLTYSNNLSTIGYTNITVLFGARATATFASPVSFQWSSDGTNWNNISFTNVTANATWGLVNSGVRIVLPVGTQEITNLRFRWTSTSSNSGNYRIDDFSVQGTLNSSPTVATTSTSLSGFSYIVGNGPSPEQNFSASGLNLTSNLVITAPTNYEISLISSSGFASTITLIPTTGTVAATTIYVRLKASLAVNIYNENINLTSTGAATVLISLNGSVTSPPAPTTTISTTTLSGFTYVQGFGPSTEQSFTVAGTNLTSNLVVTATSNYEVSTTVGGIYSASLSFIPTSGSVATTSVFVRLKTGFVVGSYTGTASFSTTGIADKTINLTGTVTNSNTSDIIENIGFSYPSNIDYAAIQSPTITNTANSIGVFQFIIRDGGATLNDSDLLGTELNAVTFNVINIANIRTAALFFGNALINNAPIVSGSSISFSGLNGVNVTALDNSSINITLRITFNAVVTDNQQMQFTIASATANPALSTFGTTNAGGATSSTTSDRNRIEVTADRLGFVVQPTTTTISSAMIPAPTVQAIDVFLNRDLDFINATTITSTGTLIGSPFSGSVSAGLITITGLVHSVAGTNLQLTATTTGLAFSNTIVSGNFDITDVANGSYRTTSNGTWPAGTATWERFGSGTWTVAIPAANTTDLLIIRHIITTNVAFAAAGGTKINIENGGVFNDNHNCTLQSMNIKSGGLVRVSATLVMTSTGNLDVEDNATLVINNSYTNAVTSLWNGIENFRPNSNLEITRWNFSNELLQGTEVTSNNYAGFSACFGNITINLGFNTTNWNFLNSPFNLNLAHKNLKFLSNSANINLATTGIVTTTIGGDFLVDNLYTGTNIITLKTSGTLNFTIKGNYIQDAATVRIHSGSSAGASTTLNIDKNLMLAPSSVLEFNPTVSGNVTATIYLKGNLFAAGSALMQNTNSSNLGALNFTGVGDGLTAATTQTINIASTSANENRYINFNVKSGAYVQLINTDFELGTNSKLSVEDGGVLDFGFNTTIPLIVKRSGTQTGTAFQSFAGSTLKITSPDGIMSNSSAGNVQVVGSNTNFSTTGTFHFIGKTNQVTGTGIGSSNTGKAVVVELANNSLQLTLSQPFGITNATNPNINNNLGGILNIKQGRLIETTTNYITGSTGGLTMEDGTFYAIQLNSVDNNDVVPRLQGISNNYNLLGNSTIELNGNDSVAAFDQYLRGGRDYRNLTFSNSGTKTITSAISNVAGTILISDAAILDVNNTMGGTATNLTMTGTSEFRTAGTGVSPDAGGIYNLGVGTKVSFTNIAAGLQSIRLGRNYYNIDIVGTSVGTNTLTGSIPFQSGGTFRVLANGIFKLSNTSGFSGVSLAALSNLPAPIIILQTDSTIDYTGNNQTITPLNLPSYANLKVSGSGIKTLGNPTSTFVNQNLIVDASKLLLNSSEIITVQNSVTANGEIELKNNAQLIQIDETSLNIGTNFKLERIATVANFDYVYWSSPVEDFLITNIPDNNRYFWNPQFSNANNSVGNWNSASGNMQKGESYIVRSGTNGLLTTNFIGKPQNGTFTKTIVRGNYTTTIPLPIGLGATVEDDNWNLLGNPYPSAISADKFILKNSDTDSKIDGNIWLWKHGIQPTSTINPYYYNFAANYSSADYIKYNLMGATPPNFFDGNIASGQGFMISMLDDAGITSTPIPNTGNTSLVSAFFTDSVTFENNMRSVDATFDAYNNNQFFRNTAYKNADLEIENQDKHRIWLDITNQTVNQTETMLLGYTANATLNRDRLYDCFYTPKSEIAIYSLINNDGFIIQGRPLPFDINDQIPLGINIANAGNNVVAIRQVDGLFTNNQTIYLQDLYLNTIHNLSANPYNFTSTTGKFNDRFVLRYTDGTLGNNSENYNNEILVVAKNNSINILSKQEEIESVEIIDILGKSIQKQTNINSNQIVLDGIQATKQTLLVKIKLVNGKIKIQKVIL